MSAAEASGMRSWVAPPMRTAVRSALRLASPGGPGARLSILIFHRVVPRVDPLFPGEPDIDRFSAICGWVRAWFNVLPLDEAVARLARGSLPARALAITFDDGYADNHDVALPVLQAHGLPATFFIATGFLGGGRMWNDTVVEAVRGCRRDVLDLSRLGLPGIGQIDLSTLEARRSAIGRLLPALKYLRPADRLRASDAIAEVADTSLPSDLMMTEAQVRAMAAAGMQIGAHTVHHPILARLDEADAFHEIASSKSAVEAIVRRPVGLFAYPNGRPDQDYGRRDADLARRAGFSVAVSTAPGAARRSTDPFELPRFTPWDAEEWRFGARLVRNLFTSHVTSTDIRNASTP